ncbi:MAG TPA: hypothetical protein VEV17_19650 [Bryobacteraceae bacterium]|nr:hypothetical protein [Bryobacteraceae bacterium]
MRFVALPAVLLSLLAGAGVRGQDAREIIRKSVELDQVNWRRMKDYTWTAKEIERHLDSAGRVKSESSDVWETVILFGEPHRRKLEHDGKPLPPAEQNREQEKLDKSVAKLEHETEQQRQHRLAQYEKQREKDRDFLREVPDLFDWRLEGEDKIDGLDVWVITGMPKPDYRPKRRDARALLKVKGKVWIDKAEYQWVRIEAETIDTISIGLFLARLNPGARLLFEQTRVNNEIWLPKHEVVSGSGRLGLLKRLALEDELTWSNFRKFQVDSKIIATQ